MYNFIYEISKSKKIALISALIYIFAPYKLTDIYSRNAVGEYTSFIFIPLVFKGIYKLLNGKEKGDICIIIGAVGLILSHTITTIYVTILAGLYCLLNYEKINIKIVKKTLVSVLIIILLTAFYWIPLIEHKAYGDYAIYDEESMGATGQDVYNTGIGLKEWFSSEFRKRRNCIFIRDSNNFGFNTNTICNKANKRKKRIYKLFSACINTSILINQIISMGNNAKDFNNNTICMETKWIFNIFHIIYMCSKYSGII